MIRRTAKWAAAGTAFLLALLFVLAIAIPYSSDHLRRRIVATLSRQLDSEVELARLNARVFPALHVDGAGLVVRHKGRRDVPPLVSVESFAVDAGLVPLLFKHITHVEVIGLDVEIPPDRHGDGHREAQPAAAFTRPDGQGPGLNLARRVVIDTLDSHDARLAILSSKPGKGPKVWAIHALRMHDVGVDSVAPFDATLTNAVPPGEIQTSGSFGPWQPQQPGRTPLDGRFTFARADLSAFKGISGMLSARGTFGGSLNRIDIHGETDTPDFTVDLGGHPVPLHATYHTVVDATNGNTRLERVDASFLRTSVVAKGSVLETPGVRGRTLALDVNIPSGRIEDVLRLAGKAPEPAMTGGLRLTTAFLIPPGREPVSEKLHLDGTFFIERATFTSFDVQRKINALSHHGRGLPNDLRTGRVASNVNGRFTLVSGRLQILNVTFRVPGAGVRLAGAYGLKSERMDFRGTLFLGVKLSQTTSGFKSLLLKAVDPLFSRKGGGSAIPIKITGTRQNPSFGVDAGRIFR